MKASIILFTSLCLFFSNEKTKASSITSELFEKQLTETGHTDVIIRLKDRADLRLPSVIASGLSGHSARVNFVVKSLKHTATKSQKNLVRYLRDSKVKFESFYIFNAIHIENAQLSLINQLRQFSEIDRIHFNYSSTLKLPVPFSRNQGPAEPLGVTTGIQEINADQVWAQFGVKGKNIVVASADGGASWLHSAIKKQYRGYSPLFVSHDYFWHDAIHKGGSTNCPANSKQPCDVTSHGTHTIGTMVGDDGLDHQIGVAPEAKWISCRNMDNGKGTLATYAECFEFFLAPYPYGGNARDDGRPEMAPHIINNSWSCPAEEGCKPEDLVDIVRAMKSAGILVVASAGNDGDSCGSLQDPPGTYGNDLISVAAFNRYTKAIAYFSSRGPSAFSHDVGISLSAPGVGVNSAVNGDKYEELDGTSMASPHVAGSIALLWSYKPQLVGNIDETTKLLLTSASPIKSSENCGGFSGAQIPNTTYGYGMLDVLNLFKNANLLPSITNSQSAE